MEGGRLEGLVERAGCGDEEAFGELYVELRERVFGLCQRLLGRREAAGDATSEVFLRARRAMRTYDRALPFSRWILSIASHYCVDQLRRHGLEERLFERGEPNDNWAATTGVSPSPLGELLTCEHRGAVRSAVEKLPERYRLPVILRYYG